MAITETSKAHKTLKPIFEIRSSGWLCGRESDTRYGAGSCSEKGRNLITNFMCVVSTALDVIGRENILETYVLFLCECWRFKVFIYFLLFRVILFSVVVH